MRPLCVTVRVATAALAVVAVAGCMSVGGDAGGRARPSQPVKQEGGEVPDGGAGEGGALGHRPDGEGRDREAGKGGAKGGKKRAGDGKASPGASPSVKPGGSAAPGGTGGPADSATPDADEPAPSATPEPSPTKEPAHSTPPEPTPAEPSSSAHPPQDSQSDSQEPAPEAGVPA